MGACISIREEVDHRQPQPQPQDSAKGVTSQRQASLAGNPSLRQTSLGAATATSRQISGRRGSLTEGSARVHPSARTFSVRELSRATKNFQVEGRLGEGGFGTVYRGQLQDGTPVAVKVLNSDGGQGEREWEAEVRFLGRLNHPNLVRLVGYCSEGEHRELVYEFLPNGSLDKWLFYGGRECLAWDVRMKIALDAARGLAFLHQNAEGDGAIIFRDLKPSNVLLDESFNAKLSDFGLAKAGPQGNKSHVSTRVMGTQGYAAPEYVFTGHLTVKSDVYTYGVVLLEIISGRAALDTSVPKPEQNLVQWARPYLSDKAKFSKVVDKRLADRYSEKALRRVVILALNCLRKDAATRPSMADVVKWLEPVQGLWEQEQQQQQQQ